METLTVSTKKKREIVDITDRIAEIATKYKDAKIVVVYVPHTTAAVAVNEGYDPSVKEDIINFLEKCLNTCRVPFKHLEGNSDAHIWGTIIGNSRIIPLDNGKLVLGSWGSIFFMEFDGPRTRKVHLIFV